MASDPRKQEAAFAVERRNLTLEWQPLAFVYDPAARQWTGSAADTTESTPFHVVAVDAMGEEAVSEVVEVME